MSDTPKTGTTMPDNATKTGTFIPSDTLNVLLREQIAKEIEAFFLLKEFTTTISSDPLCNKDCHNHEINRVVSIAAEIARGNK